MKTPVTPNLISDAPDNLALRRTDAATAALITFFFCRWYLSMDGFREPGLTLIYSS